jgi:tetratricopeptide (TPR) repeat protein
MDEATLRSLRAALAASPDNLDLWTVVARAHLGRDEFAEAAELIGERPEGFFSSTDSRLAAATALLRAGRPERALTLCDREVAELLIVRARALLALGRNEEGGKAYRRAVELNSTLQDTFHCQCRKRQPVPSIASAPT